jgi:hypothetical protein
MVVHPFFCFKKNRPSQSYSSSNTSTGSPDLTDFATNRLLLPRLWHISPLAYANGRTTIEWTENTHQLFLRELHKAVVHFPQLCQFEQWLCNHWQITVIRARDAKWIRSQVVVAKSAETGELVLTSMDTLLYEPKLWAVWFLNRKKDTLPLA